MDHPVIRRWLTKHPRFISTLDFEHRNKLYDVDLFIALDQFKEVAFRACTNARQAILTNTPTTGSFYCLASVKKRLDRHR